MTLRLGDTAPDFTQATTDGPISFHEWKKGQWAILFSHPKNFTPVCTTELGEVARLKGEFDKRHTKVVGLSVDSLDNHGKWAQDIAETQGHALNFPLIADADRKVSGLYDMIESDAADSMTVRSVLIIDPNNRVRLIITYPAPTGRNFVEILRALDALQLTDSHSVATPVNWQDGDDVIILPTITDPAVIAEKFPKGHKVLRPYLRTTPQPNR